MASYRKVQLKRYPALRERDTAEARYWRKFKFPILHALGGGSAAAAAGGKRRRESSGGMSVTSVLFRQRSYGGGGLVGSGSGIADGEMFVATAGLKVFLYDTKTNQPLRTFAKFKDVAYSGSVRADGKLVCAGDRTGEVSVFEVNGSQSKLRWFKGHKAPVQSVLWSRDGSRVFSCSDDATVRLWELSTGAQISAFSGHDDFIRCAAASPASEQVWASGSYDHTVRLWDMRQGGSGGSGGKTRKNPCALMVDHGKPVESVLFMPGGSVMLTAGGTEVKAWDILGGGRLLNSWEPHQKTVTCLALDGTGTRVLSGSLDQHVKICGVKDHVVTHAIKYSAPILSLGMSADNTRLVVGMANGFMSIRQRAAERGSGGVAPSGGGAGGSGSGAFVSSSSVLSSAAGLDLDIDTALSFGDDGEPDFSNDTGGLTFLDDPAEAGGGGGGGSSGGDENGFGIGDESGQPHRRRRRTGIKRGAAEGKSIQGGTTMHFLRGQRARPEADAYVLEVQRKRRLRPYDAALMRFQYALALDKALQSKQPLVVISLIEELVNRNGMRRALSGRDEHSLEPLMSFLVKYIANPRYSALLLDVAGLLCKLYGPVLGQSRVCDELFYKLQKRLSDELALQKQMFGLLGSIDLLLAANATKKRG